MISYTFYWKGGKREILKGSTAKNALKRAGYGDDAMSNMSVVMKGTDTSLKYYGGRWIKIKKEKSHER